MLKEAFHVLYNEFGTRATYKTRRDDEGMVIDYSTNEQTNTVSLVSNRVSVVLLPINYAMIEKVVPHLRGDLKVGDRQFLVKLRRSVQIGDQFTISGRIYDVVAVLSTQDEIHYGMLRNTQDE